VPPDPDWLVTSSYHLIEISRCSVAQGKVEAAKSKSLITEARRIMDAARPRLIFRPTPTYRLCKRSSATRPSP
jgi:hypothetical protein